MADVVVEKVAEVLETGVGGVATKLPDSEIPVTAANALDSTSEDTSLKAMALDSVPLVISLLNGMAVAA